MENLSIIILFLFIFFNDRRTDRDQSKHRADSTIDRIANENHSVDRIE